MEIQGDINNILRDIKKTEEKMSETNDLRKKLEYLNDLRVLCNSYIKLNGDSEIVLTSVPITKFQLSKSYEYINRNNKLFYDNFIENMDFHREFSETITYELEKLINEFKYIDLTKTKTKDKQKIEIVNNFYNEYNPLGTEIFNYLLSKNRIYKTKNIDEDVNGYTVMLQTKKRSFLVIKENDKDYVYEMLSLVHELGHNIDFENLNKYGSKRIYNYYNLSIYTETLPYYYQVEFLNYLINNKLNTNNSKYYFQELYDYINSYGNNLLELSEYSEMNYKFSKNDIDELFNTLNYFYGGLLGIYLSNIRKNDPDKYRYIYNRFMDERTNIFNTNQFDLIDFDQDSCLKALKEEAKVLKKQL